MPKQIISDVLDELGELGKQTAKQMAGEPGKMVTTAAGQTGIKPQSEEEKAAEGVKIEEMKKKDEEKKAKELAFARKQIAVFNPPLPKKPSVQEAQQKEKQVKLASLEQKENHKLTPLAAAAQRKGKRVEIKGSVGG